KIGRYELALQYYGQLAQQSPENSPASAGVLRMKAQLGQETGKTDIDPLQTAIVDELKKPKDKQNWDRINSLIDDISKKNVKIEPSTILLVKAQVAMMRADYDSAAKYLIEADKQSPKNLQIARAKIQLARMNPKIGPEKALNYLKTVTDQFGDLPLLRLDRADVLITMYKDKQDKQPLKQALATVTSGIDKWTPQQKFDLWKSMADRYLSLNMVEEARQSLTTATDIQPNELRLRMALFTLALEMNDGDGMKAAEEKILQIVGD